ncbi:protein of unknown function [Cupriavidus taiwanensis]|nr:protein of unknown function [Cupriavidus taiwanensis]
MKCFEGTPSRERNLPHSPGGAPNPQNAIDIKPVRHNSPADRLAIRNGFTANGSGV